MSSALPWTGISFGAYPERRDPKLSWLDEHAERMAAPLLRRLRARKERASGIVPLVEALEGEIAGLDDRALLAAAAEVGAAMRRSGYQDALVARSFALVREAAGRHLGMRHHPVQLIGGFVMLHGMVAEMETGEGKTLTATLAAGTAAMAGVPVHVITVNDYLVGRDAELMGPVYRAQGLTVGAVRQGMKPPDRRPEYACDVAYCTNKDLTFDYLRDRIALGTARSRTRLELERLAHGSSRSDQLVLRGLYFGIVDEADSVLVDEARTPLIISGGGEIDEVEEQLYETAVRLARQLEPGVDFLIEERVRQAVLTVEGAERLEGLAEGLSGVWSGPRRRGEFVCQALSALHLFVRDQHYLVHEGKVQIIDEYTGRVMPDRHWQRGLHQMIEAKEGVPLTGHSEPLAKISYQRFFRRYLRLAGMTGTGQEVAGELWSVYGLSVVRIPPHRRVLRRDLGTRVYRTSEARWEAVVERVREMHRAGRPVLVGTRSVAASEELAFRLEAAALPHRVLNARQDKAEAEVVAKAGAPGCITVATNMAGRGTDIRLDPASHVAGGLHVVATECHDSRRIDRQLFGRCGRQGDPGSFEVVASLEDELVRAHGLGASLVARMLPADDDPTAGARLKRAAVRIAQVRAERGNAAIRRALLRMDDQVASLLAFSGKGE